MAVELATARMMRVSSGSTLACWRSRSSSGSELGIGTIIPPFILAAMSQESAPVTSSQDAPMPPPPFATDERLRHTIAERMCMSPINQPLML